MCSFLAKYLDIFATSKLNFLLHISSGKSNIYLYILYIAEAMACAHGEFLTVGFLCLYSLRPLEPEPFKIYDNFVSKHIMTSKMDVSKIPFHMMMKKSIQFNETTKKDLFEAFKIRDKSVDGNFATTKPIKLGVHNVGVKEFKSNSI